MLIRVFSLFACKEGVFFSFSSMCVLSAFGYIDTLLILSLVTKIHFNRAKSIHNFCQRFVFSYLCGQINELC